MNAYNLPSWHEDLISQIPAARLLMALGYQYLTPAEALALRGASAGATCCTGVLEPWLREHNADRRSRASLSPSPRPTSAGDRRLPDEPSDGLIPTNERVYELLTLGTSLPQTIDGRHQELHPALHRLAAPRAQRLPRHRRVRGRAARQPRDAPPRHRAASSTASPWSSSSASAPTWTTESGEKAVRGSRQPDAAQPEAGRDPRPVRLLPTAAGGQRQRRLLRHHRHAQANSGRCGKRNAMLDRDDGDVHRLANRRLTRGQKAAALRLARARRLGAPPLRRRWTPPASACPRPRIAPSTPCCARSACWS